MGNTILIAVSIIVFFAGFGVASVVYYNPSNAPLLGHGMTGLMTSSETMNQMLNNPNQMNQLQQTMMNDPHVMDSWMDTILNEPKMRQQIINKMSQEGIEEFQESGELTTLLEKTDLRVKLLKEMEVHNQNLASLVPHYTDDPNLNEMMTEKMIEHNYLMNQLLDQETMEYELEESIKKHMEEHQELAELIASLNQN